MMIRRAIFVKVHGSGVQEIWPISQFPAKHKGVASGPKNGVRSPRAGSTFGIRSWSYKQWVHHLYSLLSPKWLNFAFQRPVSYCMTLSDQILCPWCNTGGEVSPQAESWKTPTFEPLRSKHSWPSEKKEGAFKNTKIKCHFKFYFVTVRKLLWIRPNESSLKEGEGRGVVVLNSSSLLEN